MADKGVKRVEMPGPAPVSKEKYEENVKQDMEKVKAEEDKLKENYQKKRAKLIEEGQKQRQDVDIDLFS